MDAMGIINLNEPEDFLYELAQHRPLAAIPFGGRYRLIDFALSNMVNSGIQNVGVLIQHKYRSLMDHLRSGKEWDLARKSDGLFILPPAYSNYPTQTHRGDVENFHMNFDYLTRSRQKYVIISGVSMICNVKYQDALNYHEKTGADITVLYSERDCSGEDRSNTLMVDMNEQGRIIDMRTQTEGLKYRKMSMETFIMTKTLLMRLIKDCIAQGDYDFVKHCLIKNIDRLKVYGYAYEGFLAHIHSLQTYFKHHMDLLKPEVWQELFFRDGFIYTKLKDEPPSQYLAGAKAVNSLVAGGCHIEGTVENSILFRGVKVHKGVHIKNSIVMQTCEIDGGAVLDYVILDKDVHVGPGKRLKGDSNYPFIIKKGMVI